MLPLFLDNHILIADKPWGLLTQPSGTDEWSLEAECKAYLKERFCKPGAVFLEAVHRIDRVVGGVVLFARTSKALSRLNALQRSNGIRKTYIARVAPQPRQSAGHLEDWLRHDEHHATIVTCETAGALRCCLDWRCIAIDEDDDTALLEIDLQTGRYHQIRVQLAHAGMPIVGDEKYGAKKRNTSSNGIGLLSACIEFEHPVTHEKLTVKSKLRV